MKALFKAIRDKEFDKVKALIEKDPQLVHATAKEPPKRTMANRPAGSTQNGQFRDSNLLPTMADPNFWRKAQSP
ncbi:MAG: hypothetical protein IPP17_22255 [Bacteroidetes bacterium]|nr:hypothetical protein [Bacteroidota bacterium]